MRSKSTTWVVALIVAGLCAAPVMLLAEEKREREPQQRIDPSPSWLKDAQERIGRLEYEISEQTESVIPGHPGGLHAANREQDLRAYFTLDGVDIVRRSEAEPSWRLHLALTGESAGPETLEAAAAIPRADGARVEMDHAGLVESWENTPAGLSITLRLPSEGEGHVVFSIEGDLHVIASSSGDRISFYARGPELLRLSLVQAPGASLSLTDGGFTLSYDAAAAAGGGPIQMLMSGASQSHYGLSSTPDWIFHAPLPVPISVATAGDINSDGFSDVVIGVPLYDNGQTDEGAVYFFYGSASGLESSPRQVFQSNVSSQQYGNRVATAGDVNGDGYADVLVSGLSGPGNQGVVYGYSGSSIGVNGTPAFLRVGSQPAEGYGIAVATAGDVNGDRLSDFLIGSFHFDGTLLDQGKVEVWHGMAAGFGTLARTLVGGQAGQNFGSSAATAGDVNLDGFSDIVVGSPNFSVMAQVSRAGQVAIFHGSAGGIGAAPNAVYSGSVVAEHLGSSVYTAGDVNGDGYSDVLVGAPGRTTLHTNEGRLSLHMGSATGLQPAAWFVDGRQDNAYLGTVVAAAGDLNGDGYADVAVSEPLENNYGAVHVYSGSSAGLRITWSHFTDGVTTWIGHTLATAGDVNGDGFSDLIFGVNPARAELYYGAADPPVNSGWFALAAYANARMGTSVASAGDVNADGYSDVIVGAPRDNNGLGGFRVYHGDATGPSIIAATNAAGLSAGGLGTSVASAGDINGDGFADVVVGEPEYSNGQFEEGRFHVYLGSASGIPVASHRTIESNIDLRYLGSTVAGAGDINGDGYADIVVGGYSDGTNAVRVYYGSAGGLQATPQFLSGGPSFGYLVAGAGDVDGDGYADVAISGGNAVLVHMGSPKGLVSTPARTLSDATGSQFGGGLASGDINGDGFSDLIVGAPLYSNGSFQEGQVCVVLGSSGGIQSARTCFVEGDNYGRRLGQSVSSADFNGDGYSDVLVGAPASGATGFLGSIQIHLGSPTGIGSTAAWLDFDSYADTWLGMSVAAAGDVDGDAFADFVVGRPGWPYSFGGPVLPNAGVANLWFGDADAREWKPDQRRRANLLIPIAVGGRSDSASQFGIHGRVLSAFGSGLGCPKLEIREVGNPIARVDTTPGCAWNPIGSTNTWLYTGFPQGTSYWWRYRVRYHPASQPFMPHSRWISIPGNGPTAKKLRTAGCRDVDSDGFTAPPDALCGGGAVQDCDDSRATIYPGAPQVCNDGRNNDCSHAQWPSLTGTNERDDDGDTHTECGGDCDDTRVSVGPGWQQICGDGLNNNCAHPQWPSLAGTNEVDDDGDGVSECAADCDDTRASIRPGGAQICDGFNNDCSAPWWPSTLGTNEYSDDGDAFSECSGDCDDARGNTYPGAPQLCGDLINNNCTDLGWTAGFEQDDDTDGYSECVGDCDDMSAATHPGAEEVNNAQDDNCNVAVDELSGTSSFLSLAGVEFCWDAQQGASSYDIARFTTPQPLNGQLTGCDLYQTTGTCFTDTDIPAPGQINWYLIRPAAPNAGSWGLDGLGQPRNVVCF